MSRCSNPRSRMMLHPIKILLIFLTFLTIFANAQSNTTTTTSFSDSSFVAILEFQGRPSDITNDTIARIESSFVEAYNQLEEIALMQSVPTFTRRLTTVEVDASSIQTDANIVVGENEVQNIRMVCRVGFTCEGCDSELRLFSNVATGGFFNVFTFDPWLGPTPDLFVAYYNIVVGRTRRMSDAYDVLLSVQQLENVECEDEIDILYTDAVVDFLGDPERASFVELVALANSFQNTYNGLNGLLSDTCDTYFREIVQVTVDPNGAFDNRRHLQAFNFSQLAFSFIFRIGFKCRFCIAVDFPLFGNDAGRRMEQVYMDGGSGDEASPHAWMPRFLQLATSTQEIDIDTECACPVDAQVLTAPSADEFSVAFNESIATLRADGKVDFIDSVEQVLELRSVSCSSDIIRDGTVLLVQVMGDPFEVSTANRAALSQALMTNYNALADTSCDPFFRIMASATVQDIGSLEEDDAFLLVFAVEYECRGCPPDSGVLGVEMARRLGETRRIQGNDDTCFCAATAVEFNAPSSSELTTAMNMAVVDLNIVSVTEVIGITEESCPANMQDCDGDPDNGCETNIMESLEHCGMCNNPVAVIGETCLRGQIRCEINSNDAMTLNGNLNDGFPKELNRTEGCGIRLTNDVAIGRASSIFQTVQQLDTTSFSVYAAYRMFGDSDGQADGLAWVLHQDARGVAALGSPGGGIGYAEGAATGIAPALIVELDTYGNAEANDDSMSHVHVQLSTTSTDGDTGARLFSLDEVAEREIDDTTEPIRTANDGTPGGLWIDYSNGALSIYHNATNAFDKPSQPTLTTTALNLTSFFSSSSPMVVGFTAGTQNQGDNHDIVTWSITS